MAENSPSIPTNNDPDDPHAMFDRDAEDYIPFEYSITSYGADYPVDGLVKRIADESIYIPSFQRGYIWNIYKASRFIESLLLGLPVPGIFLSKEEHTGKLLVIDGQQRLRTLQYFYNGIFAPSERAFKLRNVHHKFEGLGYKELEDEDRRRLDDSILHATIIRQDSPTQDDSSIYHIFERLNTGGMTLSPQEIRACVYHGPFSDLLKALNDNPSWRVLYGGVNRRMRDRELILRFLALYYDFARYTKPMKEFLNKFMGRHQWLDEGTSHQFSNTFTSTVDTIVAGIGNRAFKPSRGLNAAVADAVMVGIAKRLESGPITNSKMLKETHTALLKDTKFDAATFTATTDEWSVRSRMEKATEAFANVP